MAKHLLKFENENDYRTAKRNNLIVPNISIIKESGEIHVNGTTASKGEAEAGDIIAYDTDMNMHFIKPEAFDTEMASTYTPVSIVVIPSSHTEDGSVVGMSLSAMSLTTPVTGSENNEAISWGRSVSTLTGYDCVVTISVNNVEGSIPSITASEISHFPSDKFFDIEGSVDNIVDTYTKWFGDVEFHSPSAYNKNLSKNRTYSTDALVTNCLQDADGSVNKPSEITTNNAAIYCCHNYSCSPYKNAASWYLPSIGELGYLMLRYARIQFALEQLANINNTRFNIATLPNKVTLWSSTQSVDFTKAWSIETSDGTISKADESSNFYVRAFAKF